MLYFRGTNRLGGATVARLTPVQKVACSNHVRVTNFYPWNVMGILNPSKVWAPKIWALLHPKEVSITFSCTLRKVLPDRESNPGLPRDRRGYSPLYYRGLVSYEIYVNLTLYVTIETNQQPVKQIIWNFAEVRLLIDYLERRYYNKPRAMQKNSRCRSILDVPISALGFLHSRTNLSPFTKDFRGEDQFDEYSPIFLRSWLAETGFI